MLERRMRRGSKLAGLFRILAGDSQREFARKSGMHATLLAQYERGHVEPGPAQLARLAEAAGYTVEEGEQILSFADILLQDRKRAGSGVEELEPWLSHLLSDVYQRLLRLSLPKDPPEE
jgi:transcriptional regulator with XRE-family HTH domain